MEPLEVDFEFPRGDTAPLSWRLTDAQKELIKIVNTTEIYFTMKKNYNTQNVIVQKKRSTGDIYFDEDSSTCLTFLKHLDTATLSYGKYVYDIQINDSGYISTLARGQVTLTNEATHLANE